MDKFAQRRSILNKLHESLDPSKLTEKLFNPQFSAVMEQLRKDDDNIRSIVGGTSIGDGDPGEQHIALKSLVKSMRSNLNRREYMTAVVDLSKFHTKLVEILNIIDKIEYNVNQVHNDFLFKDLDDEKKTHLENLKKRFAAIDSAHKSELVKQAGVRDFLHNYFTDRGRALGAWEKRYPKQTKQLKADSDRLQKMAEGLNNFIISLLKDMAKSRASRNVDAYLSSANKMKEKIKTFEDAFKSYYQKNIKGFLEKANLLPPEVKEEMEPEGTKTLRSPAEPIAGAPNTEVMPTQTMSPKTDNVGPLPGAFDTGPRTENVGPLPGVFDRAPSERMGPPTPSPMSDRVGPPTPAPRTGPYTPAVVTPTIRSPYKPETIAPPTPTMPPHQTDRDLHTFRGVPASFPNTEVDPATMLGVAPQAHFPTMKSDQLAQQFGWANAHSNFYAALEALGNESPLILKAYISKYAKKISASDPETSIQLLMVAKSIEV